MRLHHLAILGFFVVGTIIGAAMVSIGYQSHEPRPMPAPKVTKVDQKKERTVDEQLRHLRDLQVARLRTLQKAVPPADPAAGDTPVSEAPSTWREAGAQTSSRPATVVPETRSVELVAMPIDYSPATPELEETFSEASSALEVADATRSDEPDCGSDNVADPVPPAAGPDTSVDVPTVKDLVANSTSDMERKILQIALEKASDKVDDLPAYELLHANKDFKSDKVYAELLIPSLRSEASHEVKQRIVDAIAQREGLDIVTVYCTPEARQAHYSMDFYDEHPDALDVGYVGEYEKGRLWMYAPEQSK